MTRYSLIPVWCFVDMLDVSETAIMNAIRQGKLSSVIDINNNNLISAEDFYKVFPDVLGSIATQTPQMVRISCRHLSYSNS